MNKRLTAAYTVLILLLGVLVVSPSFALGDDGCRDYIWTGNGVGDAWSTVENWDCLTASALAASDSSEDEKPGDETSGEVTTAESRRAPATGFPNGGNDTVTFPPLTDAGQAIPSQTVLLDSVDNPYRVGLIMFGFHDDPGPTAEATQYTIQADVGALDRINVGRNGRGAGFTGAVYLVDLYDAVRNRTNVRQVMDTRVVMGNSSGTTFGGVGLGGMRITDVRANASADAPTPTRMIIRSSGAVLIDRLSMNRPEDSIIREGNGPLVLTQHLISDVSVPKVTDLMVQGFVQADNPDGRPGSTRIEASGLGGPLKFSAQGCVDGGGASADCGASVLSPGGLGTPAELALSMPHDTRSSQPRGYDAILQMGPLTTFEVDITDAAHDKVVVQGPASLGGAVLKVNLPSGDVTGGPFQILSMSQQNLPASSGTQKVHSRITAGGSFFSMADALLLDQSTFTVDGTTFRIDYSFDGVWLTVEDTGETVVTTTDADLAASDWTFTGPFAFTDAVSDLNDGSVQIGPLPGTDGDDPGFTALLTLPAGQAAIPVAQLDGVTARVSADAFTNVKIVVTAELPGIGTCLFETMSVSTDDQTFGTIELDRFQPAFSVNTVCQAFRLWDLAGTDATLTSIGFEFSNRDEVDEGEDGATVHFDNVLLRMVGDDIRHDFEVAPPEPDPVPAPAPAPVIPPATVDTAQTVEPTRISGPDRIGTAIAASQAAFEDGTARNVVLARDDIVADAVTGTPLAARLDAPILLTATATLSATTRSEISRVIRPGGTVYIMGGESAISAAVMDELVRAGLDVRRVAGANRFETAAMVADLIVLQDVRSFHQAGSQVLLTDGSSFETATIAGPAASAIDGAVLLTDGARMPAETQAWMDANGDVTVTAIGAVAGQASPDSPAVTGTGWSDLSVAVAEAFFTDPAAVGIATSATFPDPLVGGTHIARLGGPLLLTDGQDLPAVVADYLRAVASTVTDAFIYGGAAAVSAGVQEDVATALGG